MVLKNLSVSGRLALGFGLTGLLFTLVVWQYHQTLFKVMNRFDTLQTTQAAKKDHYLNIHRYMLEARRSEKDFLSRKNLLYPEQVAELVQLIDVETKNIQSIEEKTGGRPIGEEIGTLIHAYHNTFKQIVAAWKVNGLDHNTGLQGRFRQTIHTTEEEAKNFNTNRLYLTLLQIRRAEKDLGLRKDPDYRNKVQGLIRQFRSQINRSTLDPSFKNRLVITLEMYQVDFERYANQVLEGENIHGGKGPFRDTAHTLENLLTLHYVPDLEEEILTLRRREKDYLLRGGENYVQEVQQTVAQILINIKASALAADDKKRLISGIKRYESDFLALVNHDKEIVQLTAKMGEAVLKIEPLITLGVAEAVTDMTIATETTRQNVQQKTTIGLIVALIAILLSIGFAFYFSRLIIRPINTLTQLAELFAPPEQDPGAIDPNQKDEILILTHAMGRMTGHLQDIIYYFGDHIQALNQTASTLEKHANQPLSQLEKEKMALSLRSMSENLKKKLEQLNA
ncbi:MAG: methyl-accepting chemotaxis protein [Magnetococcales bacterium]|nr:methyl-accepting chemotaxis protein [Magnetococcales bacterium]